MKTYTIKQVADLTGVGRSAVVRAKDSGDLKFHRLPTRYGRAFQCERKDLIGWLVRIGFPLDLYRHKLADGDILVTCGWPPRLADALAGFRVEFTSSPTRLGMSLAMRSAWAVLLSFDEIGRDQSMSIATEIRRDPGRPLLIAIVGDDESGRPGRAADLFDIVLPRDVSEGRLLRTIRQLRSFGFIQE